MTRLILLSVFALHSPLLAEEFTGKVTRVVDGDSIIVLRGSDEVDIRLEGIDCPELLQSFGRKATQATSKLAFGKVVTVKEIGTDKYGRTLADVILPDGRSLNQELVRLGYAWWYHKYSDDQSLAKLEAAARRKKQGLWIDAKPVPPWVWRDQQRSKPPPKSQVKVVPNGVEIVALLPNPKGQDAGNEKVVIQNYTGRVVDLQGWKLRDLAGNQFPLAGKLQTGRLDHTLKPPTMPLNNDGDEILLIDADGVPVSRAAYNAAQVRSGQWIEFGR